MLIGMIEYKGGKLVIIGERGKSYWSNVLE